MEFLLWSPLFMLAGFVMESLVCFYHRSREYNRIFQTALFSTAITMLGVLAVSRIVFSVINSPIGHWSLVYVFFFALGKGFGTYASLTLWDKLYLKTIKKESEKEYNE
jgi:hypothetical protein